MTFEEFKHLAQSYNVIPVSRTLLADTLTPVSAYLKLRQNTESSFLFESVEGGERVARYSFIGRDPMRTIECKGKRSTVSGGQESTSSEKNFFELLQAMIGSYRQASVTGLPRFSGGLVGFIGYDSIRFIEEIPDSTVDGTEFPDSILGLFTTVIVFDHLKHHVVIIVNALLNPGRSTEEHFQTAQSRLDELTSLLQIAVPSPDPFALQSADIKADMTADAFCKTVQTAKKYIFEGDIFQVVLSQRFSASYSGDAFNVYRALRIVNPSPYLYFLDFHGRQVVGSSPEILVRMESGTAEVYPIAGTRKRGQTDSADRQLEQELLMDEKERAEHVMLVDLGRNDLGRISVPGTVKVDRLMDIVRYSHVMHIASRVVGKVAPGKTCFDVFQSTFPAGTVSGAPKIRAMEIIDEIEPTRRGLYAGGVGYFDFTGNMDFCIAIRTMFAKDNRLFFQAGAGIVADSVPEREYEETINKSRALVEALRMAEGIRS